MPIMTTYSKAEIEDFLYAEAALQDAGDWEGWMALWAPGEVELWIPVDPFEKDQKNGASIIQDTRSLLEQRVKQLAHRKLHSQQPATRTSRIIGNIRLVEPVGGAALSCAAQLHFVQFRPGRPETRGQVSVLAGRVEHNLVRVNGEIKIRSKKINIINSDGLLSNIQTLL